MSTQKVLASLQAESKKLDQQIANLASARKTGARPAAGVPAGAPFARKGESALSSRGFQFLRLIGSLTGRLEPEHAKIEMDVHHRMKSAMNEAHYYEARGACLAPFATAYLPGNIIDERFQVEMRQLCKAGVAGADASEMDWLQQKSYSAEGKAFSGGAGHSWLDATQGGSLVAPPDFGELIDLFRNKDALLQAGARTVPLPPSGRIKYPRQTGASTGYWVGENTDITKTTVTTGDLTLSAKKVGCFVVFPNELLRFASNSAEALVRQDMTKTLSLTMDLALIDGMGGDVKPLGLLNTPGISTVTPTTVATNGDTLSPQDVYEFISAVEQANADFEGFIMRPDLFYKFVEARASTNQFVFDQFRNLGSGFKKEIGGFPVVTTNNVPKNRIKGSGTTLTCVIGGMWSDFLIGMWGSIEFVVSDQGATLLQGDQTAIRAILTCDGGARHPGAFAVCDSLLTAIGS
jgi:HK97 family phage major capsid protein